MKFQGKSIRKASGGRLKSNRSKRKFELGRDFTIPAIGAQKLKVINVTGNGSKVRVLKDDIVNVTDTKTGTTQKVKMTNVTENKANKNYVRRNYLTKGAVVTTEIGKAKITSRPGQDGSISAILLA